MKMTLITRLALFMLAAAFLPAATATAAVNDNLRSPSVYENKLVLRDLWIEHVFWVRNYVDATHHDAERASATAESRVVSNARSIANAIKPYYGQEAADGLFKLLAGHWQAIRDYNTAVLSQDSKAGKNSIEDLTVNARKIARFLSSANPFLPEDDVFSLLAAHGGHHVTQIDAYAKHDFDSEAEIWDAMRKHMFVIADAITEALAQQYPDKFKA